MNTLEAAGKPPGKLQRRRGAEHYDGIASKRFYFSRRRSGKSEITP